MMTTEEYQWTINLVKDRYHLLKLSFEQAELVYHFEEERMLLSDEHFFSVWEEMDYELDNFQRILNEKQFKKYYVRHLGNLKNHEEVLVDTDVDQQKYIDMYREELTFLLEQHVPSFCKELNAVFKLLLNHPNYKAKIEYLKNMYKLFLDSHKIGIISSHYRHSKRFQPKTLEASLLQHQLGYILPRYTSFKEKMDEPTGKIAEFLIEEFDYMYNENIDFFIKKEEELSSLMSNLQSKYIGEMRDGGWCVTFTATSQQIREQRIMQVVLMDQKMFRAM